MTGLVILVAVFALVLIGVSLVIYRRDRRYEQLPVKNSLSDTMKGIIGRERQESQARKDRFEDALQHAQEDKLSTTGNENEEKDNSSTH